jgi:hypothetical protein
VTTPNGYFPSNNGTFNADDTLVQPWWIPGWTAQAIVADTQVAASSNLLGPGFPTNLAFVNVIGNFFDLNASGLAGFITLKMSDNIVLKDNGVYFRLPQRFTGTMNMATPFAYNNWGSQRLYIRLGRLDILVFATDQTTSGSLIQTDTGNPLFYYVTEHWLGGRTYQIQVPVSSVGTPTDINTLIVPGTIAEYKYDPVFPDTITWDESSEFAPPVPGTGVADGGSAMIPTLFNGGIDGGNAGLI